MKKYEINSVTDVIKSIEGIIEESTSISKNLLQARGSKDFAARAHREKALFGALFLKELGLISNSRYRAMVENLDKKFTQEKMREKTRKWQKVKIKRENIGRDLDIEMLEYGDAVELENGDTCVCIRKELDASGGIITQELNLVNIFTGEEHNINYYKDDLTHEIDPELSIKRFAN